MNFLKKFFSSIARWFTGGGAEKAFNTAADLLPKALPIVERISQITPTRSDDEILAAFNAYEIPVVVAQIRATPASDRGYLLLKLATEILAKQFPNVATNIINTAIQLAVTGSKAK